MSGKQALILSGDITPSLSNTLAICVANGYTIDLEPENYLLLTAEKYEVFKSGKCLVYGKCLTNAMETERVWIDVCEQPKETVVEIFSNLRFDGIDGQNNDKFEKIYNKLIKKTKISGKIGSHLSHDIGAKVQFKNIQMYQRNRPMAMTTKIYEIIDTMPNDSFADLSCEYELQNIEDSNDIIQSRAACIRAFDWHETDTSEFDTCYTSLIDFNGTVSIVCFLSLFHVICTVCVFDCDL